MFRRGGESTTLPGGTDERMESVLGPGIAWQGNISGTGGVRVDGAFDGDIAMRGPVVIGEQGRVTSGHIRGVTVIVSGSVKGDITAHKVEITRSGRVWGNVVTASFSTEEGAFLRGQITMEEEVDLGMAPLSEVEMALEEGEAEEAV